MPKGPRGERRPADAIGCAVTVAKIATGEIIERGFAQPNKVKSGKAGGKARAENLTSEERSRIATKAAARRWHNGVGV